MLYCLLAASHHCLAAGEAWAHRRWVLNKHPLFTQTPLTSLYDEPLVQGEIKVNCVRIVCRDTQVAVCEGTHELLLSILTRVCVRHCARALALLFRCASVRPNCTPRITMHGHIDSGSFQRSPTQRNYGKASAVVCPMPLCFMCDVLSGFIHQVAVMCLHVIQSSNVAARGIATMSVTIVVFTIVSMCCC